MKPKKPKLYTCKHCRGKYEKRSPMQRACSADCAYELVKIDNAKKAKAKEIQERVKIKQRKKAIKSLSELAKEAEHFVNKYVRLRDYYKGCCSCDRPAEWNGQWHASHLKSVGANSSLRFHLWNIRKACSICNNHLSGNIAEYRGRTDPERLAWLDNHERSRKYPREYLIRLKTIFSKRCRILEKRIGLH